MSLFEWDNTYSVGIKTIDDQHRKIIELIDELVESIRNSREDHIISAVLEDLSEYANYHFTLEGKILQKYPYKESHDHSIKHREFTEKIHTLKVSQNVHVREIPRETLDYLTNWFRDHELKYDSEYYEYLRNKDIVKEIDKMIKENEL